MEFQSSTDNISYTRPAIPNAKYYFGLSAKLAPGDNGVGFIGCGVTFDNRGGVGAFASPTGSSWASGENSITADSDVATVTFSCDSTNHVYFDQPYLTTDAGNRRY